MPDETHGYQIVIEISEAQINEQIAHRFACTSVEDQEAGNILFPLFSRSGESILLFNTPWIDLRGSERNQVNLHLPFNDAYIEQGNFERANLDGEIIIRETVNVTVRDDNKAQIDLQFDDETDIDVKINNGDGGAWVDLLRDKVRQETRERLIDIGAANFLGDTTFQLVEEFDLGSPTRPLEIGAQVIYGDTSDRDAIAILQRTIPKEMGHWNYDASQISQSSVGFKPRMAVRVNSDFLLHNIVGPKLLEIISSEASNGTEKLHDLFKFPSELREPQDVSQNGKNVKYNKLISKIRNGQIVIEGEIQDTDVPSGLGKFDYTASFTISVILKLQRGELSLETKVDDVNVELDNLDVLVWFKPGKVRDEVRERVEGNLKDNIKNISLPEISSIDQIYLTNVSLDKSILLLEGYPKMTSSDESCGLVEVSECRVRLTEINAGINLDESTDPSDNPKFGPAARSLEVDLLFDWSSDISAVNGAVMRKMGLMSKTQYSQLNPHDIEKLDYDNSHASIAFDQIPVLNRHLFGDFIGKPLAVGVRTSQGRYAKAKIWRSNSALYLCYLTYNRQIEGATLKVENYSKVQSSLIREGSDSIPQIECDPGRGPQLRGSEDVPYKIYAYKYNVNLRAKAPLLAPPLSYEWSIGNRLIMGSDDLYIDGATITYHVDGDQLTINTKEGESSSFYVMLKVEDNRGLSFHASRRFSFEGKQKIGGASDTPEAQRTAEEIEECIERVRAHQRAEVLDAMKAIERTGEALKDMPFGAESEGAIDSVREIEVYEEIGFESHSRKPLRVHDLDKAIEAGMGIDLNSIRRKLNDL